VNELCFIPMAWVVGCAVYACIVKSFDLRGCRTSVDLSTRRGDIESVHIKGKLTIRNRLHVLTKLCRNGKRVKGEVELKKVGLQTRSDVILDTKYSKHFIFPSDFCAALPLSLWSLLVFSSYVM